MYGNRDRIMKQALQEIEARIAEPIRMEELSGLVYFSRFHFQRLFRRYMGTSVMEYVKKRRLSLAREELCQTEDSVLTIALRWGYQSAEGFSRAFKERYGISPALYRRNALFTFTTGGDKKMKKTDANQIQPILTEYRSLTDQIQQSSQIVRETAEKSKLQNFAVVAEELSLLRQRADEACQKTESLLHAQSSFSLFQQKLSIIQMIEDLTVQIHVLSFCTQIQLARTNPQILDTLSPIAEQCRLLTQAAENHSHRIHSLFQEAADLLCSDLREQQQEQIRLLCTDCRDLARYTEDLALELIGQQNPSFQPSLPGAELQKISADLQALEQEISAASQEDALSKAWQIPNRMEKHLFLLNILFFHSKVEFSRSSSQPTVLLQKFQQLIDVFLEKLETCQNRENLLAEWSSLLQKKPHLEISKEKLAEDLLFQGRLMSYALKTETERIRSFQTETAQTLSNHTVLLDKALEKLMQSHSFSAFAQIVETVSHSLQTEGNHLGERGAVLLFLSESFSALAKAVHQKTDSEKK